MQWPVVVLLLISVRASPHLSTSFGAAPEPWPPLHGGGFSVRASPHLSTSFGAAPEPWPPLHGGGFSGNPEPFSPDPLVRYLWPASVNASELQVFSAAAVAAGPSPTTARGAFTNASSAVGSTACAIGVLGAGTLIVDFGVEMAAWLEFDSPDLTAAEAGSVQLGISEYNVVDWVGGFKQGAPLPYCDASGLCTFRLETNGELYEGVRYGFITLAAAPARPWTITGLRAVAQAKPVNYVGSFHAAGDPVLERVWWTAAYTVRATLQANYMGSILMDRGDRFSWTGDAHPSQATALAAFGGARDIVFNNLNRSKADCQGIATYCLYFVLSVSDYFAATGDGAGVAFLQPNVQDHLEQAEKMWDSPEGLRFVGWDDRTGSGFANNTTPETQALYRLLAIRAWTAASIFLNATGSAALAARYASLALNRTAAMRAMGGSPWYGAFGLHARAEAVTAGFLTPAEAAGVAAGPLGDIVKLPSQSQFNQYFILQALGLLGQLDRAAESIREVWGSILDAGATTFWETSHPSAAQLFPPSPSAPAAEQSGWVSLCHPWSSGAAPWLSAWLAGIRPLAPGYAAVLLAPHVAHSMAGVAGALGTPRGVVALAAARQAGAAVVNVTLPAGVRGTLRLSAVTLRRLLGAPLPAGGLAALAVRAAASPSELAAAVGPAADAPLLDEAAAGGARAPALELQLAGGRTHSLRIAPRAAAAQQQQPWAPLGSPFPPPAWPGALLGSDTATRGDWLGVYGRDGHVLLGYDAPARDPFCGQGGEGSPLRLACLDAGATIQEVRFASYGDPSGDCPAYAAGSCAAPNSSAVVRAACLGRQACAVDVSNDAFGGDPCPGVSKSLFVVAHCSSGGGTQPGGGGAPPADRARLPSYVTSAAAVEPARGFCGARFQWSNGSADGRALQDPDGGAGAPRHLGYMQPCGCPTAPFDILLTDAAKAANKTFRLSLYFVDFAPSASCGGLDGTARTQEVYLLTGYPDLSPLAPRAALSDFAGGVWLTYAVQGDVRVRISTVRGDMAVLSAVAFDSE